MSIDFDIKAESLRHQVEMNKLKEAQMKAQIEETKAHTESVNLNDQRRKELRDQFTAAGFKFLDKLSDTLDKVSERAQVSEAITMARLSGDAESANALTQTLIRLYTNQ